MTASSDTAASLVTTLRPYADRIVGSADRQSVDYVKSTWESWLDRADVGDEVVSRVFAAIGSDTVSRQQLRSLAKDADSADDRLVLLIATLIWGRGKSNGRMRDAILRTLDTGDGRRDEVLMQTAQRAREGKAADAYRAWALPGLQAAFFTKWLWAASSTEPGRCCLVQDKRVWNSLGAMDWDSRTASGRRDWPSRYAAYVRDVHSCANSLGISAEDVEYALFKIDGDLEKLQSL